MMKFLSRRQILASGLGLASAATFRPAFAQETESYGLSAFGDLAMPADFKHFAYVNPQAPKGGVLSLQIKQASGNQSFDTFNTLNPYVFKGDGAAGIDGTFDTLMSGSADETDALYGLVARSVRISADGLRYRFFLRPEARFHDGSKLTAKDVAFSMTTFKEKAHPSFRAVLTEFVSAEAVGDHELLVTLSPKRSRNLHLTVAGLPIFSAAYWQGKDFEASTLEPILGSGPYKVGRFEVGRFIEFDRVKDYWAADLPVNVGFNNFDKIRFEYFRDRQVAFEAFKAGAFNLQQEYTSRFWATNYDFPAVKEGRVKREAIRKGAATPSQGWYFNTRRDKFKDRRIREALGLVFDFEWTNANIMFNAYKRTTSFFENTEMKAVGLPKADELALLEPFRAQLPAEVFGEPFVPPVSDGSGNDRNLLRRADQLLKEAGCKRDGNILKLPDGTPFEIEFLDSSPSLQPHTRPYQDNLKRLGIKAESRIVDTVQYRRRMDAFDFDMASMALGGSNTPGDSLRVVYGSKAAETQGSRNIAGIKDPAVDALIELIAQAKTRAQMQTAARALDRVLRAGRYWVAMWYNDNEWFAYWDVFSRPERMPKYDTGAPSTWWYDVEKAKKIGL